MRTRVLVADQSEACFYDLLNETRQSLRLNLRLTDETARLHNRDLVSDKPGRVFDHAPPAKGRRGAVGHHGTGGENTTRKHEAETFARKIAAELVTGHNRAQFDSLVLMAGPSFLGLLRSMLPKTLEHTVIAQVNKDLVHQSRAVILEQFVLPALASAAFGESS